HYVTPGIDEGEAILQKSFEVTPEDTPETVAEKVHHIEYEIFPKAINKVLGNQ
ncbi:formyltransferase family protein, partial [Agrobacterium tumefaciens]|uniref:formyltransferase family protein n=2 Tax=Pseudomonadati TaxID=3379134 RepID=UPI003C6CA004